MRKQNPSRRIARCTNISRTVVVCDMAVRGQPTRTTVTRRQTDEERHFKPLGAFSARMIEASLFSGTGEVPNHGRVQHPRLEFQSLETQTVERRVRALSMSTSQGSNINNAVERDINPCCHPHNVLLPPPFSLLYLSILLRTKPLCLSNDITS